MDRKRSVMKMDDTALKARFTQKLRECYEQHKSDWLEMEPPDLIEHAEEIATDIWLVDVLPDTVSDEDAQYLLRFCDPLEVVRDAWLFKNGLDWIGTDEAIQKVLWGLVDRGYAEYDYELEDDQSGVDDGMGMSDIT